jgi:hypothetical protein
MGETARIGETILDSLLPKSVWLNITTAPNKKGIHHE